MKVFNFHGITMSSSSSSSSDRCQVVLQNAARRDLGRPVDPKYDEDQVRSYPRAL